MDKKQWNAKQNWFNIRNVEWNPNASHKKNSLALNISDVEQNAQHIEETIVSWSGLMSSLLSGLMSCLMSSLMSSWMLTKMSVFKMQTKKTSTGNGFCITCNNKHHIVLVMNGLFSMQWCAVDTAGGGWTQMTLNENPDTLHKQLFVALVWCLAWHPFWCGRSVKVWQHVTWFGRTNEMKELGRCWH